MNISSFNNIIQKSLSDDQENVMKGKLKFTLSRVEFYKRTRHKRFSSHFECDRQCLCYNDELLFCHRIRKDFTAITPEERRRFSDALRIAVTNLTYKDEYRTISAMFMHRCRPNYSITCLRSFYPGTDGICWSLKTSFVKLTVGLQFPLGLE